MAKVKKTIPRKTSASVRTKSKPLKRFAAAPSRTPVKKIVSPKERVAPSRSTAKVPTTMEELLAVTGYELRGIRRGQILQGTVTDVSKRMVLLDIGGKTEGLVVDKEYEATREFIQELAVGDIIPVYVLTPENERGQMLLSLKKAAADRTWVKFDEALKTGEVLTVRGLEPNRGGLIVRADSLQGFVPSSQFGKVWAGRIGDLMDQTIKVRVIEVDREKNRLIFSEKQVSEQDEIKKRAQALSLLRPGEEFEGVISGIMPFGVFVTIELKVDKAEVKSSKLTGKEEKDKEQLAIKVEGLVHISEISWEKVDDPHLHFSIGNKVKVQVLGVDVGAGKLNLSVKRLGQDPWKEILKKYPSGTKAKGKVTRVAPFGVFVTLEPGIEGLLHISKIPAGEEPAGGDDISVYVEQVDVEHRRLSLGMVLTEVPVGYK